LLCKLKMVAVILTTRVLSTNNSYICTYGYY
jgi:hypothetical protein